MKSSLLSPSLTVTVNTGTAPWRRAATISRRTLCLKFGRVKRPTQTAFGSRAIFQTSAALCRWPVRRYARHWCQEAEPWSTKSRTPASGALIVFEKGKLFSPDDYGAQFQVILGDEDKLVDGDKHPALQNIAVTIPRTEERDRDLAMKKEWFAMMKGGPAAYANFDNAAYLTEIILLGCIAMRVGVKKRMDWDGPNMKATNHPDADKFIKEQYRQGGEIPV